MRETQTDPQAAARQERLLAASSVTAAAERASCAAAANTIRRTVRDMRGEDGHVAAAAFAFVEADIDDGGDSIYFAAFLAADGTVIDDLTRHGGEFEFENEEGVIRFAADAAAVADRVEDRGHGRFWYVFDAKGPDMSESLGADVVPHLLQVLDAEARSALWDALIAG